MLTNGNAGNEGTRTDGSATPARPGDAKAVPDFGSFLREHAGSGGLVIEEWNQAADLFIVLTMRDFQIEAMLPWSAVNTLDAYRRNAEQVADLMLRLYGRSA